MYKIFLTLLLSFNISAFAEWVSVGETETKTIYADPSSLIKNGNMVRMWRLYDLKRGISATGIESYKSSKVQHEFDCKNEQSRIIFITAFSGNMGKGKVVYAGPEPAIWEPIAPESATEVLWKFACSKY